MIVCDGFTGNVALKISEGLVEAVERPARRGAVEHVRARGSATCCRGARSAASASASTTPSTAARRCSASPASASSGTAGRRRRPCATRSRWRTRFADAAVRSRRVERTSQRHRASRTSLSDCIHLSRTGIAEGRHGPGARRGVPESAATTFDEADAALGEPLSALCFEGPDERLTLTENTQPAILAVSVAALPAARVARAAAGVRRRATASASTRRTWRPARSRSPMPCGSCAAAAATCRRPCRSARARWRRSSGLDAAGVAQACAEAARGRGREPGQPERARAGRDRRARGGGRRARASGPRRLARKRVMPLPVSAPFHCALMKPAEERLAPELRALAASRPARAGRRQRRRRAEARRPRRRSRRSSGRCRRRCAGRTSSRRLASRGRHARMLRWVRAPC